MRLQGLAVVANLSGRADQMKRFYLGEDASLFTPFGHGSRRQQIW